MVTTASTAEKLAAIRLKKCGGNLKKAFTWSSTKIKYFGGVKKPGKSKNAVEYYAAYGFKYGKGDCYVTVSYTHLTTFRKITRRDDFHQVLKGLEAALSYPSLKVKLNCVPTCLLYTSCGYL